MHGIEYEIYHQELWKRDDASDKAFIYAAERNYKYGKRLHLKIVPAGTLWLVEA